MVCVNNLEKAMRSGFRLLRYQEINFLDPTTVRRHSRGAIFPPDDNSEPDSVPAIADSTEPLETTLKPGRPRVKEA